MASGTSNKPFEWTGRHQGLASPPQALCLPLKGSVSSKRQARTLHAFEDHWTRKPAAIFKTSYPAKRRSGGSLFLKRHLEVSGLSSKNRKKYHPNDLKRLKRRCILSFRRLQSLRRGGGRGLRPDQSRLKSRRGGRGALRSEPISMRWLKSSGGGRGAFTSHQSMSMLV